MKISPARVDLARLFDQPRGDELDFAEAIQYRSLDRQLWA